MHADHFRDDLLRNCSDWSRCAFLLAASFYRRMASCSERRRFARDQSAIFDQIIPTFADQFLGSDRLCSPSLFCSHRQHHLPGTGGTHHMDRSFVHLPQRIFSKPHFFGEKRASKLMAKLISETRLVLCRPLRKSGVFCKQQKSLIGLNVS